MSNSSDELQRLVEALGLEKYKRHIFLCADQTDAKCAPKEKGLEAWAFLKNRLKELKLVGARLVLLSPSRAVRRALKLMRLEPFFLVADDLCSAGEQLALLESEHLVTLPTEGSTHTLRWQGEITAANAEEVWGQTCVHISQESPPGSNVIDLSAVRFIDSSGLGLMIRAKKLAASLGTDLEFTNAPDAVRNVVRLARLDAFLLSTN